MMTLALTLCIGFFKLLWFLVPFIVVGGFGGIVLLMIANIVDAFAGGKYGYIERTAQVGRRRRNHWRYW